MERIAIDMDGVIADLLTPWLKRYNEDYKDNIKPKDIKQWYWEGITKCGSDIYKYLEDPNVFSDAPVIENSQEVIKELMEFNEIFIVTSPWGVESIAPKYYWLKKHFPFIDERNYVFTGNKGIVDADWMIDDRELNLAEFKGLGLLFDAPHNRERTSHRRIQDWISVRRLFSVSQ